MTELNLPHQVVHDALNETKTHNRLTRWLTAAIIALTICTWVSNRNSPERYVISGVSERSAYVLDTKTSELWIRTIAGINIYMGTNENPTSRPIKIKDDEAEQGGKGDE